MLERKPSHLHQRKLTRVRYRLRSHTRSEQAERNLRNRSIPLRSPSVEKKLTRRNTRTIKIGASANTKTSKISKVNKKKSSSSNLVSKAKSSVKTKNGKSRAVTSESTGISPSSSNTPASSTSSSSTSASNASTHYVYFDWNRHPNAWGCIIRPYFLRLPAQNSASTSTRVNRINMAKPEGVLKKHAVEYINIRPNHEKRGGYIIGSDTESDFVMHGTNIMPRHCVIYSQVKTCIVTGRVSLKPYLSNLSSRSVYIYILQKNIAVEVKPQESISLKPNYAIRFTKELKPTEPYLVFFDKTFIVPPFEETYSLGAMIGSGSFSVVHKAIDKKTKEVVAVKTIEIKDFNRGNDTGSRFAREVGTMMSLEPHPGIVQTRNVYENYGSYHIVMEYASRGELFDFIKDNQYLSEPTSRIIFYQLFRAIQYLHDRNIVHRDIKPENSPSSLLEMTNEQLNLKTK